MIGRWVGPTCSWPVWTEWRAELAGPVWTTGAAVTPPLSASPSVSKSQSVLPQLAGPLGSPSISGGHLRKGPGGCRSYAARSNRRKPKQRKQGKRKSGSEIECLSDGCKIGHRWPNRDGKQNLLRCTFKQINTFTLVYRNELHNLFTDIKGRVSWWRPNGHCISNGG